MHLQPSRAGAHPPFAVPAHPQSSDSGDERQRFCVEKSWRCLADTEDRGARHSGILVSRWLETRAVCRHEKAVISSGRHIIGVALKATRVKLTRGSSTVFDGPMPAGTLHVTGPSQPLTAEFRGPCDFVHFHVSSDYLRECQEAVRSDQAQQILDLNDLIVRDQLAELLSKTLVERATPRDGFYVESVGQTLVMHLARLVLSRDTAKALPKWRIKRVQDYVGAHLEGRISLSDLARAAGLSRMHFAAQFRAATGHRPHDYLLQQRIESAKAMLSTTNMPLAEVALAVGFGAQPHFSTVFKQLTHETPARWRKNQRACPTPSGSPPTHGTHPSRSSDSIKSSCVPAIFAKL
jgi:AraC family transcriptional regulator